MLGPGGEKSEKYSMQFPGNQALSVIPSYFSYPRRLRVDLRKDALFVSDPLSISLSPSHQE